MGSDSESSSSSGSERSSKSKKKSDKYHKKEKKNKEKKEKKEGKKNEREKEKHSGQHQQNAPSFIGSSHLTSHESTYRAAAGGGTAVEYLSSAPAPMFPSAPNPNPPPYAPSPGFPQVDSTTKPSQVPPFPVANDPPPSGFRVPLRTDSEFAHGNQTGPPVAYDVDQSPIFIGSALFETSVHPCKVGPHLQPHALVPYGGVEHGHNGRYDLLPFVPEQMEWVHTSHGQIPHGRRPIEGGYEEDGSKLYHALANVNGVRVPGKTGGHLGGANVSFGGQELA